MEHAPLAVLAEEERRYDALPPWAWRRPANAVALAERKVVAMERLVRENERAFADTLTQLSRLMARHRMNARAFAARLDDQRAVLARLKEKNAAD